MPLNFDKHAQKGNEFLNALTKELGNNANKAEAGKILRAVFRALRNHLTLAENFKLLSQLPMALKAVYVDGWMPTKKIEISRKKTDFIMEVLTRKDSELMGSVSEIVEGEREIQTVFKTLKKYISKGEFENMEAVLPRQLKEFFKESIYKNRLTIQLIPQK